jgi:tRNA(Ile)-lysidine synthase
VLWLAFLLVPLLVPKSAPAVVVELQARLAQRLALTACADHPQVFCVAFSGGLDSTVLLHALSRLAGSMPGVVIRAVHIDHAMQPGSAAWAGHCEALCAGLQIPYESRRVVVDPNGSAGPEATARAARYAALTELLQPGEVLLLAQHQDDQLETYLLQLMRGGGVHGLAAMPADAAFAHAKLSRPLLDTPRHILEAYASAASLKWVDDPSNANDIYERNYLRHQVLPQLLKRWPSAAAAVARSARYAAEAAELSDSLAALDAVGIRSGCVLGIAQLQRLPLVRQRNLVRFVIRDLGLPVPAESRLLEIWQSVLPAGADALPQLRWPGGFAARYRGWLYLLPAAAGMPAAAESFAVTPDFAELEQVLELGGAAGRLILKSTTGRGLARSVLQAPLEIRFRRGGERLKPAAAAHHRSLKNLFQEAGVLPWMRGAMPLLYSDGKLLAVGDTWLAAEALAVAGEPGLELVWQSAAVWCAAADWAAGAGA